MANLSIAQTDWVIDGATLTKRYRYVGILGESSEHLIRIDIDTSQNAVLGGYHVHVCFLIEPSFMPAGEGFLVAQLAAQDALLDGPFVTVLIKSVEQGRLVIQAADRPSVEAFLEAIASCKPMRLLLLNEAEPLLELPIPNDAQYLDAAKPYFSRANEKYPQGHGFAHELLRRDEPQSKPSMRSERDEPSPELSIRSEGLQTILFLCAAVWLGGKAISSASPYSTTALDLLSITDVAGVIAIILGLIILARWARRKLATNPASS